MNRFKDNKEELENALELFNDAYVGAGEMIYALQLMTDQYENLTREEMEFLIDEHAVQEAAAKKEELDEWRDFAPVHEPVKKATVTVISIWSKDFPSSDPKQFDMKVDEAEGQTIQETLEKVFETCALTDICSQHKCPTLSVGDLVKTESGYYFCDRMGWKHVEEDNASRIMRHLTSRDAAMGWDWLVEKSLVVVL